MSPKSVDDKQIETQLLPGVEKVCASLCEIQPTKDSEFQVRNVIEYSSRLRVSGLEKFNAPCVIGAVNYYRAEADREREKAIGAVVVYVNEEISETIFKRIPGVKAFVEDRDSLLKAVEVLAEETAQEMKARLASLGYPELVTGETKTYVNTVPEGVPFDYRETKYFEGIFYFLKQKAVTVDLSIGEI